MTVYNSLQHQHGWRGEDSVYQIYRLASGGSARPCAWPPLPAPATTLSTARICQNLIFTPISPRKAWLSWCQRAMKPQRRLSWLSSRRSSHLLVSLNMMQIFEMVSGMCTGISLESPWSFLRRVSVKHSSNPLPVTPGCAHCTMSFRMMHSIAICMIPRSVAAVPPLTLAPTGIRFRVCLGPRLVPSVPAPPNLHTFMFSFYDTRPPPCDILDS